MLKITDKDYFLPTILALSGGKIFSTGETNPMLIRGVCTKTGKKNDYVVKYRKSQRMTAESSCRELLASFMGRELDLNVFEPVVVNVTQPFVDTLVGNDGYNNASNSLGLNFGCKYFVGAMEFIKEQHFNDTLLEQVGQIFAFDIFISNSDRRSDKANMLTDGDKILIYDHELAFSFILNVIKDKEPWLLNKPGMSWIKNHYFYPILKKNEFDFGDFVERFKVINENFWERADTFIPKEWITEQVNEIKTNLDSLIKNKSTFLQEIDKVLK